MDNMLICHISTTYNHQSGFAIRTTEILKACVASGYDVMLVIGIDNDYGCRSIAGVRVFVVPELLKRVSLKSDLASFGKIRSLIKKYQPAIVHTHLAKAGVIGRLASSGSVAAVVHTVHGPTFPATLSSPKRLLFWLLETISAKYTDYFVFVGEDIRRAYVSAGVARDVNSRVIYTAKPEEYLSFTSLSGIDRVNLRCDIVGPRGQGKQILCYVGRLVASKQQDHAIQLLYALHEEGRNDMHLVLVGKALLESELVYEQELTYLVQKLKLEEFVHFLGYRKDALQIMNASDLVILPSKYEGLPNVMIEAILSETLIVSYDVSGTSEILGKLKDELVVPQGDIEKMKEVVIGCFESDGGKFDEYVALKKWVLENYSQKQMVKRKLAMYREILAS